MTGTTPSRSFRQSYLLLVGIPVVAIAAVLAIGSPPEDQTIPVAFAVTAVLPPVQVATPRLGLLLAQLVVILLVTHVLGKAARRLGQPRVVGEMMGGILLGPSLFGALAPGMAGAVFPETSLPYLSVLSQIGLVLFMFVVGFELDLGLVREHRRAALLTSHASICVPFLLGSALALPLYSRLAGRGVAFHEFALFMGAAMSVTAFPVLARILRESRLNGTRLGAVAITCAAVDDVTAWCVLAAVAALVRTASEGGSPWVAVGGAVFFGGLTMTVGRRMLARLATAYDRKRRVTADIASIVVIAVLAAAAVTEWLGLHALFGAFVLGAAMPRRPELLRELAIRFDDVLHALFLPLFFGVTGLRTRLVSIDGPDLWIITVVIVVAAVAGKLGGSAVGARLSGLPWRESVAIGVLMNTRGLVELVFLNIGLDLGILTPTLFAMMVLMALVTTLMTAPMLWLVWTRPTGTGREAESLPGTS